VSAGDDEDLRDAGPRKSISPVRVTTHALDGDNAVSILYVVDVHEKFGRGGLSSLMNRANRMRFVPALIMLLLVVMMAVPAMSMAAEATVNLGTTAGFAVLAGSTITNTGPTTITGDVGLYPGSAFVDTGVTLHGARHIDDAVAEQAQTDLVTAYNDASGRALTPGPLKPVELGGLTLGPGVYSSGGVFGITGTLTLDARGDPEAVFIFKSTATLITASRSVVRLVNGARFCRVFWVVPSSATLGANSTFVGHILALTDIHVFTGATVEGQLLAQTEGEVTLAANTITNVPCASTRAIHIAKTASPTALTAGPGWVTYTYRVTNPGTFVLSGVTVTDNKVSPVTYVSGDVNKDKLLQPGETWIYTARVNLKATTTNTATARGSAAGGTVTATAVTTVVVAGELLPNTAAGELLPNTATPWYNVLLAGAVLALIGAVGYWRTTRKIYD